MEEHTNQNINDTRIHLALSPWDLTDGYNQHAGVTIASFLDNCHGEKVAVHLLYDERLNEKNPRGAEENTKKYGELCAKFGADLYYHHVDLPEWVNELESVKSFTPGALMRIYLPDLLPDVSKIIYLDCDIVVKTDVRDLWGINIHGAPLAAVHDSGISSISSLSLPHNYFQRLNTTPERYFNSGVLIMNLDYIRNMGNFSKNIFQFIRDISDFPWIDQEALNKFFGETYLQLDAKYNMMVNHQGKMDEVDGIIHYASSSSKPWKGSHGERDYPYWHYLLQTPWVENQNEVFCSMLNLPNRTCLRETDFVTIYEDSGLPYVILMKKIVPSIFTLTKKRVGAFIGNHLRFK